MLPVIRNYSFLLVFLLMTMAADAQPEVKKESKPYRIITSGKQVTIKSTKDIRSIMVWTASGHRIVEQKDIHASSFSFSVTISSKIVFLLIELKGNEKYTEKLGLRG